MYSTLLYRHKINTLYSIDSSLWYSYWTHNSLDLHWSSNNWKTYFAYFVVTILIQYLLIKIMHALLIILNEKYQSSGVHVTCHQWALLVEKLQCVLTLTLMPVVANFANTKLYKKAEKSLKPWQTGTHLRVICKSYPMNTNSPTWQGLDGFQKSLYPCALDESSLSTGRVNDDVESLQQQHAMPDKSMAGHERIGDMLSYLW